MYFFDSYAILEIIDGNQSCASIKEQTMVTTIMNVGEIYFSLLKRFNKQTADYWLKILKVNLIEIDIEIIKEAMLLKYDYRNQKLSMVDCIGYVLAKKYGLHFVTGDKAFENMENVLFLK